MHSADSLMWNSMILLLLLPFLSCCETYAGIWWWTWTASSVTGLDSRTNLGIAFSGWTDISKAIAESNTKRAELPGMKFISLGGGNGNGHWSSEAINRAKTACMNQQFIGFDGVAFDIEEGDPGLDFKECFSTCKAKGYKVLVTVSHSAPYGVADAARLMDELFRDQNIDILSPQLYTSGQETENDFATTAGIEWPRYAQSSAAIVPSIVAGNMYPQAQSQFRSFGVKTQGWIQWSPSITYPTSSPSAPAAPVPVSSPKSPPPQQSPLPVAGSCNGACKPDQCCSKWGFCGTGPDYCGPGCKSGPCTAAPLAPPTTTPQSPPSQPPSPQPVSPLPSCKACRPDECCSKWGFCGKGATYCVSGCSAGPCFRKTDPTPGLSVGALVGIIVGSICAAFCMVGLIVFLIYRLVKHN